MPSRASRSFPSAAPMQRDAVEDSFNCSRCRGFQKNAGCESILILNDSAHRDAIEKWRHPTLRIRKYRGRFATMLNCQQANRILGAFKKLQRKKCQGKPASLNSTDGNGAV